MQYKKKLYQQFCLHPRFRIYRTTAAALQLERMLRVYIKVPAMANSGNITPPPHTPTYIQSRTPQDAPGWEQAGVCPPQAA